MISGRKLFFYDSYSAKYMPDQYVGAIIPSDCLKVCNLAIGLAYYLLVDDKKPADFLNEASLHYFMNDHYLARAIGLGQYPPR